MTANLPQMWRNWDRRLRWNRRLDRKFALHHDNRTGGQDRARAARATQGSANMAKVKSLDDLFVNLLKDIYYAEKQILKALPKMAKNADSAELEEAFLHHLEETKGQVERLEQVFALCELKPVGKTCPAIKGILEEGQEMMKEAETPDVLDAGMIADAQAVEHYEIARYGTLIAWANQLGMQDAASLLQETLDQEYTADRTLSEIAEGRLNREAA
jgi:ferritin-like metal-binding protein YciE